MYRPMEAVEETGLDVKVIDFSFSDAVNPALAKVGLGPTIGIGNESDLVPGARASIAYRLGVLTRVVRIFCVSQQFLSRFGHTGGAHYSLNAIFNEATSPTSLTNATCLGSSSSDSAGRAVERDSFSQSPQVQGRHWLWQMTLGSLCMRRAHMDCQTSIRREWTRWHKNWASSCQANYALLLSYSSRVGTTESTCWRER